MIEDYLKVVSFPDCILYQFNVVCESCRDRGERATIFITSPLGITRCPQCSSWDTKIFYGFYLPEQDSRRWLFRTIKDLINYDS